MTDLERLEQRVRQLEDERVLMREALVTALKLHANSLQLLRSDHPYADEQIVRQREIAAEVAGMVGESMELASQLIQ